MGWARLVAGVLVTIGLSLSAPGAGAVESDPLPVPKGGPRERAVTAYNAGVKLLLDKKYGDAQKLFEEALAADEQLAEAHNNLAFSLRARCSSSPSWRRPTCTAASSSPRWEIWTARAPTTRSS
jgi:hypothetical protein